MKRAGTLWWLVLLAAMFTSPSCTKGGVPGGSEVACADGHDDDGDGLMDCEDPDCLGAPECVRGFSMTLYPERHRPELDLLFVIDNSGGMVMLQDNLAMAISYLTTPLRIGGELPDLHVGVVSTDLGAGSYGITFCEQPGGDQGDLQTLNCTYPLLVSYLVDVVPRGCDITRQTDDKCSENTCDATSCGHEPSTVLSIGSDGCPRCLNFPELPFGRAFECITSLGMQGCGFEQPLEAMRLALADNPDNTGFLTIRELPPRSEIPGRAQRGSSGWLSGGLPAAGG